MDLGGVLFAVCGLALVCMILVVVLAVVVLRVVGAPILAPIAELLGLQTPDEQLVDDYRPATSRAKRRPQSGEVRAQAQSQSLDFDDAVRRHSKGKPQPKDKLGGAPPPPKKLGGANRLGNGGSGLRRRRTEDYDEVYDDDDGGLF